MPRHVLITLILLLAAGAGFIACRDQAVDAGTPAVSVPTPHVESTSTPPRVTSSRPNGEALQASRRAPTAKPSATATAQATATRRPLPTSTQTRQLQPTPTLPATPTYSPAPQETVTATPSPSATAPVAALAIHRFDLVAQEEMNRGKRLTFVWSATGDSVTLVAATRQRFIPWWQVPLSGTLTVELENTLFRDPGVTLNVYGPRSQDGALGEPLSETITIPWNCDYDYFFSPAPGRCPRDAAKIVPAAQQAFEGGRMVWLQPEGKILVLFDAAQPGTDDSLLRIYDDTWTPGEEESDPAILPPPERFQPVRGFGKVWRNNPGVREGLGWALAPESAFMAMWQFEFNETIGTTSYLRLANGRIARLLGYYTGYGSWSYLDS